MFLAVLHLKHSFWIRKEIVVLFSLQTLATYISFMEESWPWGCLQSAPSTGIHQGAAAT